MAQTKTDLLERLRNNPNDARLAELVSCLEAEQTVDLKRDASLLRGVWELRWSSSTQPWLSQAPWLDNLQTLDPNNGHACNLLKIRGPLGSILAISVNADIKIKNQQRIDVKFRRGGLLGPKINNGQRVKLHREVKQSFPAWLDITVLDEELRICRGNAGTVFVLLKRTDLSVSEYI